MARTIQSPGVEINEIDLSLRPNLPVGTSVLAAGFSDKGPTDEVIQVTSLSEFEQIYGLPTTPAERYFYHSVRPLFNSPANILAYRLPYGIESGEGFGNDYGALVYPCSGIGLSGEGGKLYSNYSDAQDESTGQSIDSVFVLGKPVHFQLTRDEYFKVLKRDGFEWSDEMSDNISSFADFGKAGMIVLNKGQTTVNNKFEGYYVGVVDNTNMNDATNYDGIVSAESLSVSARNTKNYLTLPTQRLNFALSAENNAASNVFGQEDDSISEVLENLTEYDLSPTKFNDTLSVGLFKLRQSVFASDVIKLDYVSSENYVGSLDFHRQIQSQTGGAPQSYFLGFKEDQSPNIEILVNDNLSHRKSDTWLDEAGEPKLKVRMASTKFESEDRLITEFASVSSSYLSGSDVNLTTRSSLTGLLFHASKIRFGYGTS